MQDSLDGGLAPTPGTFLPTGSHTYVVSFSNCAVNYWGGEVFELNGVVSTAYNTAEWSNLTATVSADSMRFQGEAWLSERRFDNLKVAINGTEYTLNGSLELFTIGSSGSLRSAGEIRIINNGTLVARIYGNGGNDLRVEVLVPLVPL